MTIEGACSRVSRVFVATDLSARSDRAVERALMLASESGANFTLVHMVDADLPGPIAERQCDDAKAMIERHARTVPGSKAAAYEMQVILGKDHVDLLRLADKMKADLLVLGIHRDETRGTFGGSTAERVIREGSKPVLVVRGRPAEPYRRVLAAVDLGDHSRQTIHYAAQLAPRAEFHLVRAFETPFKAFLTDEEVRREISRTHHEQMERFVKFDCPELPSPPGQIVRQGPVERVIIEQADHLRPDLLVVGVRRTGGVVRRLIASLADTSPTHPQCDVLAVR